MKIIAFADLHTNCIDKINQTDYSSYNCSVCITLGDINSKHLQAIAANVKLPIYGVLGNHDEYGMLERYGITQLDEKEVNIDGVLITGLSGSSRYKPDDKPMLTQKESVYLAKRLHYAEIFISHDSAYGLYGAKSDKAHCGLKGISRYIKKYKPIINLHGHHHENSIKKYKKTTDICIFGCSVIEIDKNGLVDIVCVF